MGRQFLVPWQRSQPVRADGTTLTVSTNVVSSQVLNAIKYAARHPMVTVPEQRYLAAAQATTEPAIIMAVQEFVDEQISTTQSGLPQQQQPLSSSPPVRAV